MATSLAARGWIPHRHTAAAITDPFVPSYWDRRQRNPELAKALSLIQAYVGEARNLLDLSDAEAPLRTANHATAHLYFSNPFGPVATGISKLFSTHPPIDERITALRRMGDLGSA